MNVDNLSIYNKSRSVPQEAQREIKGGRLSGKTDINPMWRIKELTEQFGPCGVGWKYIITDKHLEHGGNGEIAAFVDINLYYKADGAWSEAIPGTGGSSFVANEKNGAYVSDECFKMALTDAISVACKALGFGADVYWEKDKSKYDRPPQQPQPPKQQQTANNQPSPQNAPQSATTDVISDAQCKRLYAIGKDKDKAKAIIAKYGYVSSKDIKKSDYEKICKEIET